MHEAPDARPFRAKLGNNYEQIRVEMLKVPGGAFALMPLNTNEFSFVPFTFSSISKVNPRPAGVFSRTRPAGGGGADSVPPA